MSGKLLKSLSSQIECHRSRRVEIGWRVYRRSTRGDCRGFQAFVWIDRAGLGMNRRRRLRAKLATEQPQSDLDGVRGIVLAAVGIERINLKEFNTHEPLVSPVRRGPPGCVPLPIRE